MSITGRSYDPTVGDKYNRPLAKRMRELVSNAQTTKGLTAFVGISPQAISSFKSGTHSPTIENLQKIAEYFDTSVDYLLGLTDDKNPVAVAANKTGLEVSTVELLAWMKKEKWNELDVLNLFLSDESLISLLLEFENLIDVRRQADQFDKARALYEETFVQFSASQKLNGIMDRVATAFIESGYKTRRQMMEAEEGGTDDGKH